MPAIYKLLLALGFAFTKPATVFNFETRLLFFFKCRFIGHKPLQTVE
jgi:hypothetical protein